MEELSPLAIDIVKKYIPAKKGQPFGLDFIEELVNAVKKSTTHF